MRTSIVIPTLNEEANIGRTILDYKRHFPRSREIIVVDGGSKDKTRQIAKSLRATVYQAKTRNAAEALIYGFKKAKGSWIVMTDADDTYKAWWARKMVDKADKEGLDLVIGKRKNNRYLSHRIATWLINGVMRVLIGTRPTDIASGLRVLSNPFAQCIEFQPDEGMWPDMIIKAENCIFDWDDYPISYSERKGGVSKIKGKGHKIVWRYLKAVWNNRRQN
jgi:glycosyltransferase involved in cell wall biosynthesis